MNEARSNTPARVFAAVTNRHFLRGLLAGACVICVASICLYLAPRTASPDPGLGVFPSLVIAYCAMPFFLALFRRTDLAAGMTAALALSFALLPRLSDHVAQRTALELRDLTDKRVAIASQKSYFERHLETPTDPRAALLIRENNIRKRGDCPLRLVLPSDTPVAARSSDRQDSNGRDRAGHARSVSPSAVLPHVFSAITGADTPTPTRKEWIEKAATERACAEIAGIVETLPYVLIEYEPHPGPASSLARKDGISGSNSIISVATEFTQACPEGCQLGRWEFGYYPNEKNGARSSGFFDRMVRWKDTGPHGAPFLLPDVIAALKEPRHLTPDGQQGGLRPFAVTSDPPKEIPRHRPRLAH